MKYVFWLVILAIVAFVGIRFYNDYRVNAYEESKPVYNAAASANLMFEGLKQEIAIYSGVINLGIESMTMDERAEMATAIYQFNGKKVPEKLYLKKTFEEEMLGKLAKSLNKVSKYTAIFKNRGYLTADESARAQLAFANFALLHAKIKATFVEPLIELGNKHLPKTE